MGEEPGASEESELPADYDEEALARCREIFWGLVEDPENVKLTITSEFRATVRELTEDKEYAAKYEQDRHQAFAWRRRPQSPAAPNTWWSSRRSFATRDPTAHPRPFSNTRPSTS